MGKRVPGDNEQLNNATQGAGDAAEDHEALIRSRVAQAKEEEQRERDRETQANQKASQKQANTEQPKVGEVRVSAARIPESSKYGRELSFAEGTQLDKNMQQVEGAADIAYVVGRVMTDKGWLVGRAIPIEEARAAGAV